MIAHPDVHVISNCAIAANRAGSHVAVLVYLRVGVDLEAQNGGIRADFHRATKEQVATKDRARGKVEFELAQFGTELRTEILRGTRLQWRL